MSAFALAFPGAFGNFARPLLGLGLFASFLMFFKPIISGLLRAALLVLKPRRSLDQRKARNTLRSVLMLNRMARELDVAQPNLAAELRLLAARG